MAEALLASRLRQRGVDAVVESAGIAALVGSSGGSDRGRADARTRARSRAAPGSAAHPDLIRASDLVLVMERDQVPVVEDMFPAARGRVQRLGRMAGFDVPDPYRRGRPAFVRGARAHRARGERRREDVLERSTVKTALAAVLVLASGCALAPGMRMDEGDAVARGRASTRDERFQVEPISPELVASLSRQLASERTLIPDPQANTPPRPYTIAPYDVLQVTVWDHPELTTPTGQFRSPEENGNQVDADGTVFYPYAGDHPGRREDGRGGATDPHPAARAARSRSRRSTSGSPRSAASASR